MYRLVCCRLSQLKTSGEENWKRRVTKDKELSTPVLDVKMREKSGLAPARPVSISDRLTKLEVSADQWKERVEETDAKNFTVANKLMKSSKTLATRLSLSSPPPPPPPHPLLCVCVPTHVCLCVCVCVSFWLQKVHWRTNVENSRYFNNATYPVCCYHLSCHFLLIMTHCLL